MLSVGDPAPDVSATNQHGESVSPSFAAPTVVYFYPRDFTGGCTVEANEFQAALPQFREGGVEVYGVSTDDADTHADFAAEEGLTFDLLADPGGELAAAFGVDTQGGFADRVIFALAEGEVVGVYEPTDLAGHADEVLRDLRNEFVRGG